MIVCVCHRVSDQDIRREAASGCSSFDELQDNLRVGTACGACADCARQTFHEHAASVHGQGAPGDRSDPAHGSHRSGVVELHQRMHRLLTQQGAPTAS